MRLLLIACLLFASLVMSGTMASASAAEMACHGPDLQQTVSSGQTSDEAPQDHADHAMSAIHACPGCALAPLPLQGGPHASHLTVPRDGYRAPGLPSRDLSPLPRPPRSS